MSRDLFAAITHARTFLNYLDDPQGPQPYVDLVKVLRTIHATLEASAPYGSPRPGFDPEMALATLRKVRTAIVDQHPEAKAVGKDATGNRPVPRNDTVPNDRYRTARAVDETINAVQIAKMDGAFEPQEAVQTRALGARESREMQRRKDKIANRPTIDGTEGVGDDATAVPSEPQLEDAQDIFFAIQSNQSMGRAKYNTVERLTRSLSLVNVANLEYQNSPRWDGCKPVPLAPSWIAYAKRILKHLSSKRYVKVVATRHGGDDDGPAEHYETFSFDTRYP